MSKQILSASSISTMNPDKPRATAVAIDDDRIVEVGSLEECQAKLADATVVDLGDTVLTPGFIEPHSHPLLSGISIMAPAHYIAPWVAPTWDDVVAIFKKALAESPADASLAFFGFDKLLHGVDLPC